MKIFKLITVLVLIAFAVNAKADGLYNITFTDGGANVGSGQIDVETGYAMSGYFNVTAGLATGSYLLYTAGGFGGTYGSPLTSPSGQFVYDNAVYLASNPQFPISNPYLDLNGLLFTDGGGNEVNLWANADNLTSYTFDAWIVGNGYIDPNGIVGEFNLSQAPEPSPMMLGLLSLSLLGIFRNVTKRKTS